MRIFDTKVQHLKYKVLREVARAAYNGTLAESVLDIPSIISPGKTPTMRCCVYKERAIVSERVKVAMGGDRTTDNVIQVIDIACDGCPMSGYEVTSNCRGCIAHRCEDVCPKGAIVIDENQHACIDKSKCVECGLCSKVCPYNAIYHYRRPCKVACKVGAISMTEDGVASIDHDKCVSCGACVYQCPFGAIMDKSYILDAIDLIKKSQEGNYRVHAVVAPAISSQFTYAKLGQVVTGLKELGFDSVVEAALGADMVAFEEAQELVERRYLSSSCCPAFVELVKKRFPSIADHISSSLSPMGTIGKFLKEKYPGDKVVFIGPCTAKKKAIKEDNERPYVDVVLTFEELQALFDAKEIDLTKLEESELNHASYFGRIFARCGGLGEAVAQSLKEHGTLDFEFRPVMADGLENCIPILQKAVKSLPIGNFIEGMACSGGCIGGAGCLTHAEKSKIAVQKYGESANSKMIFNTISDESIEKFTEEL